ncbi:MAG TPA: TetR/AcrR family transcriptional regulator [Terriglobales bacterium]|nr:TetR/AcrR family transcriptional regulator [Terriglobales bacterium]
MKNIVSDTAVAEPASKAEAIPDKPLKAAERIRRTAFQLFYRQGIRAVGVDEIVTQAGVTKPSLYRSFASKDELAAAYLTDYDCEFWNRFNDPQSRHPGDVREQLLDYLRGLSQRASKDGYRGCGLTNAAVEYPSPDHPARAVALRSKHELRRRLRQMAADMGARDPDLLGDGLLLLLEGAYASGQMFGDGGPAGQVAIAAEALIDACCGRQDRD